LLSNLLLASEQPEVRLRGLVVYIARSTTAGKNRSKSKRQLQKLPPCDFVTVIPPLHTVFSHRDHLLQAMLHHGQYSIFIQKSQLATTAQRELTAPVTFGVPVASNS
jgi:hypothetical protein